MDGNLTEFFSEIILLLKLLCMIPMTSIESKRCLSTLKRIKFSLKNTLRHDQLVTLEDFNALGLDVLQKTKIEE